MLLLDLFAAVAVVAVDIVVVAAAAVDVVAANHYCCHGRCFRQKSHQ